MLTKEIKHAFEVRKSRLLDWIQTHPLRQIQWEATQRCDMQCLHCGSECSPLSENDELKQGDFLKAIESVVESYDPSSIELISITGGEPLLRNDLPNIIARLNEMGFSHITVQTNGNKLIDKPQLLEDLVASGLSGIGINIDGLKESHDRLRGRDGHFDNMCRLVKKLRQESSLYVTVTTVISKLNIDDLSGMKDLLRDFGVTRWRLIEIQPIGRAHSNHALLLNRTNFRRLVDFVRDCNLEEPGLNDSSRISVELGCTGWFGAELEGVIRPYIWHCHAGISTLGIWSNGDIGGCTDIHHSFSEGNVKTDQIPDVWENRFLGYRDISRRNNGLCRECNQWAWCHGGGFHLRNEKNELQYCPFVLLSDKI